MLLSPTQGLLLKVEEVFSSGLKELSARSGSRTNLRETSPSRGCVPLVVAATPDQKVLVRGSGAALRTSAPSRAIIVFSNVRPFSEIDSRVAMETSWT